MSCNMADGAKLVSSRTAIASLATMIKFVKLVRLAQHSQFLASGTSAALALSTATQPHGLVARFAMCNSARGARLCRSLRSGPRIVSALVSLPLDSTQVCP